MTLGNCICGCWSKCDGVAVVALICVGRRGGKFMVDRALSGPSKISLQRELHLLGRLT